MPFIKKEFIDSLLDKVDILDVLSDYTELKKKGTHFFGLSPFQKEDSPSFCVNRVKQRYNCYSSHKSGNVISFLMDHENMDYPEAIKTLANKYGIPVEYENDKAAAAYAKKVERKKQLRPALELALKAYQEAFAKLPADHPAKKEVFDKRKYTKEQVLDWEIGFAPGQRFIFEILEKNKLVKEGKELSLIGDKHDKFWNRVVYPINDKRGFLIGFAGRDITNDAKAAKWINPAESELYLKNKTWFALNRALKEIAATGEANIVEGYNDVIAWHENGLVNSIAPCGTAITDTQIAILKKYCKRINFCFDDDAPGKKAMLKYIPLFLANGFTVNVQTTAGVDPDDFVRVHKDEINNQKKTFTKIKALENDDDFLLNAKEVIDNEAEINKIKASKVTPEKYAIQRTLKELGTNIDGFRFLLDNLLIGNAVEKSKGAYKICEIIAKIEDEALVEIYIPWVKAESKVGLKTLRDWVKQAKAKFEAEEEEKKKKQYQSLKTDYDYKKDDYTLPDAVSAKWEDVRNDIYKYGVFSSDNRMWIKTGSEGDYTFKHITNCSVQIIQHMADEEYPMKLLRIKNIHNIEKIFDCPSESVDSTQRFTTALSNNGNFIYTGDSRDFLKLKVYLFEKMGTGRKIEVLGHQPEGFWVWNNLVQLYDGTTINIDDNGIFVHEDISYYVPSANSIYARNPYKYEPQKRFKVTEAKVTFSTFASKAIQVHGNFAISGILFAIASLFQDIIINQRKSGFPILFLYGPPGTGKDEISGLIGSFYGEPQQAQNLEGGASTMKAKIIKLAQFFNGVSEFSEYKRGDDKVDGILKGIWDRNGYERSNLTSKIAIESVPILSALILTGNDYPSQEALITRLFSNEMDKNVFSEEEARNYDEFKAMSKGGYSSFSRDILKHRKYVEENFLAKFKAFRNSFKEQVQDGHQRMIENAAILGATYELFKDKLQFPFSFVEMESYFKKAIEKQMRKLKSEGIINKWWDCFLYGIKSPENVRLKLHEDFKMEGRKLCFHFNQVFAKMSQLWFVLYKEAIPGKTFLTDQLKSSDAFVKYYSKGLKMAEGRNVKTSSGYELDLEKTGLYDEIYDAIEYQRSQLANQGNIFTDPPATPNKKINSEDRNPENDDLFNEIIEEEN